MFLNSYAIPNLICFVGLIALASFVFKKRAGSSVGLAYLVLCLSAAVWQIGTFFVLCSKSEELALSLCRLTYLGSLFIPATTYHFVISALGEEPRRSRVLWTIYLTWFLIFLPLSQTPWFIAGVYHYFWGYWWRSGFLHVIFLVALSVVLTLTFYKLINSIKATSISTEKKRRQYLFLGLLIAYIGAIDYVPNYGVEIYPFGYIPIYLHLSIYAYAIVRYKFLDIEVIIKKTLVFVGIVTATVSVIALPFALIQAVIGKALGIPNPFILMALGVVTTVLIYRRVERILIDVTDRYLFQKKINYRLLLREASEYLAHVDSLKQQARNIVAFLLKKARIASASVYAFAAPDRSALVLKASHPLITNENLKRINLSHPIFEYFSKHQGPLEINALKESREDNAKSKEVEEILTLMKSLHSEAAIPCFGGEAASRFDKKSSRLRGVLFLGHQKSDQPYSEEDMDVFFTLGQESSIAFENARLYDEAINRAAELAKTNEELNETNKKLRETHAALLEEKKRALLAGMSSAVGHEIRSPLMPLSTHVYFSRKRLDEIKSVYEESTPNSPSTSRQKFLKAMNSLYEQLSGIETCNNRIKGIVNTLLNLVRKRSDQKGPVQLELLVASAIEEVRFQTYWETLAAPKIERQIPAGLPFILGITQDLQGVFVNLIINSLHAMEKTADKKITIKAKAAEDKSDRIKIEFADTGGGIPEELQEKVFEHGVTTKGEKGTGIGLFYCKDIIERVHGGTISLTSKVNEGTCFTITLPVYKEAALTTG